ncbi:hypothetical protein HGRIS_007627 [Hohenbuehelia grisea]|uniref:Uncharacterized protein n=1 Tax=Hohenbuehelia grisea TaxID=104357 RepID=A0ABR3J5F4_9AGAR
MKFSALPLVALALVASTLAAPAPLDVAEEAVTVYRGADAPAPTAMAEALEVEALARTSIVATVTADGLRYRRCQRTSCAAVGQYPRGRRVAVKCYTTHGTTPIENDHRWAKLNNGYWVSMRHLTWRGVIPRC